MFAGEDALEGRTHVWIESRDDDDGDEDAGEDGTGDEGGGADGDKDEGGEGSGAGGVEDGGGQDGHTHSLQLIELAEIDEDDVEDPDYVDAADMFELHDDETEEEPMERDSEVSSSTSSRNEDDGHGADHGHTGSGNQPSKKRNLSVMDLKFDWNWLSAARQVVEGNLRDLLLKRHVRALRALVGLDGLRMGSAPGMDVERMLREREREMSQGTGSGEEDGNWDWAGVEGQWRSVVWLRMCSG